MCGGNGENVKYGRRVDLLGPEVGNKIVEMHEFMKEYSDLSSGAWGKPEDTDPLIFWTRKDPEYLTFRAEVQINLPLETVVKYAMDDEFLRKSDSRMNDMQILRQESPQCDIMKLGTPAKWPISARDMVVYRCKFYSDQDSFTIVNFNASESEYPPAKNVVRIDVKIQGRIITRTGPRSTRVIICSMMNPKVSGVPMFVLRGKMKQNVEAIYDFKLTVEHEARLSGY